MAGSANHHHGLQADYAEASAGRKAAPQDNQQEARDVDSRHRSADAARKKGSQEEARPAQTPQDARETARVSAPLVLLAQETGSVAADVRPPYVLGGLVLDVPLVLCAEPGMGKSHAAMRLARQAQKMGYDIRQYNYEDLPSAKASQKVVRTCAELRSEVVGGLKLLAVFDGIAAGDEYETESAAKALERLWVSGCKIIVCLRPEALQLAEALTQATRLYATELLFGFEDESSQSFGLTGGIPALVGALSADAAQGSTMEVGARYVMALEKLVGLSLRTTLPVEDQLLRLAALLLGKGTMEELAIVARRCDAEQFATLARDVPLLGIDLRTRSFCCHGLDRIDLLKTCVGALQAQASQCDAAIVRACGVLASRGEARRSAALCALCAHEQDLASLGTLWGVAYVMAGEGPLVSEALRITHACQRPLDSRAKLSEMALNCLVGTAAQFDTCRDSLPSLKLSTLWDQRLYDEVQLLVACRGLWRSPRHVDTTQLGVTARERGTVGCVEHVDVARLLADGHFAEAYARVSDIASLRAVHDVTQAFACDDLWLSLMLSGGAPDEREWHLIGQARRFYAHAHLERLQSYHAAFVAMPSVLMGTRRSDEALEEATVRAEHAGDAYLQALFLAVSAVGDLRGRAWSRAHVRAERAATMAQALGEAYLASAAELVDALSREMLGDYGVLGQWCEQAGRPSDLMLLGQLAAHEAGELSEGNVELLVPTGTPCPRDALWLLSVLISDCQALSEGIRARVPAVWLDCLRAVRLRQQQVLAGDVQDFSAHSAGEKPAGPAAAAPAQASGPLDAGVQAQLAITEPPSERVRISVLGGFKVEVDGEPLPDDLFDRRRSRDLVTLLCLAAGHRMRRYRLIDVLWPESDYFRGPRKLYEATGEARKQLKRYLSGSDPLVSDRSQGTLGFDIAQISFDVDEFEREARMALVEDGDDFWVLDHARRMERLYATGPDPHLAAFGEQVVERLEELKTMYVDAAVAAGEAALRVGKTRLAVRYAFDAHRLRELREDAMILLVQALRASGRSYEVAGIYRRYSRRLIEEEGVPPSLALRRIVALAREDGPEAPGEEGAAAYV